MTSGRRVAIGRLVRRLRRSRRDRLLAARTAADLTPPDPSRFGAFGSGSVVVPPARVSRPDRIFLGDDVVVLEHAWLSVVEAVDGSAPTLRIGSGSRIGRFSHIACVGEVTIGEKVQTSERVFIGDTYHGYEDVETPIVDQPMASPRPVRIGDGAFIGIGASILMGVTIGEGAYVGAGAVVVDDVPAFTLVVGNPARVTRRFDPAQGWVSATGDDA